MKDRYLRILSLFILVFQGFGIRMLNGVIPSPISFWTFLLFVINFKAIKRLPIKPWKELLGIFAFYTVFCFMKGVEPLGMLFACWFSAFFVLSNYYWETNDFVEDLFIFTKICVIYTLLHIPINLFLRDYLFSVRFGLNYNTFYYLFYFGQEESSALGLYKINGFCWEPSCWNCLLNINLALSLIKKEKKYIALSILSLFAVSSTTGLVVMIVAIGVFMLLYISKKNAMVVTIGCLLLLALSPIISEELENKTSLGSGATRMGDFYVAQNVLIRHPFMGGDLSNITSDNEAMNAKLQNWNVKANISDYDDVGMTNGFAELFVEWGLFVTIFIFYLMFQSPLFFDRKSAILVSIVFLCVLIGTPIARTGFFYLFPISSILLHKEINDKYPQ